MDYEQLRKLAAGATPGPWVWRLPTVPLDGPYADGFVEAPKRLSQHGYNIQVLGEDHGDGDHPYTTYRQDCAFIAAAREAVPALLDERDRLAAEVVALREALRLHLQAELGLFDAIKHGDAAHQEWLSSEIAHWFAEAGRSHEKLTDPSPAVAEVLRLVERGRKAESVPPGYIMATDLAKGESYSA